MDKSFLLCLVLLTGLSVVPLFNREIKNRARFEDQRFHKTQMSTEFVGRVVNKPK